MPSINNQRIAKNALFLYARMLIVMVVSLFTVRVVLDALGAEDYGINNVVGGVVSMFAFLTSTMTSASQRFFAYSLGQKDYKKLSEYFSVSFWCYVFLIIIIVIFAETAGLWFVINKLTIPSDRTIAAMWVYQFAILSFVLSIISVPFNSIIIAREKMNIYAYIGLCEAFIKLLVAFLIYISPIDKLICYSALSLLAHAVVNGFYIFYGIKKFDECKVKWYWDRNQFGEVVGYSGWSLFGAIAGICRSHGINILLNVFFNPVVNAARAIAYQVNSAINQFVLNFYKAVQPQIVKTYAAKEQENLISLVYRSSRFCFYLILLLSIPVLLETPFILSLWLKDVPEMAVLFTRLVILTAIVDSTQYPLQTAISATGKIKNFQIVTGGLLILNLPVAYIFLRCGYPPQVTMYIAIVISIIAQITRIFFASHYSKIPIIGYIRFVITKIVSVSLIAIIMPLIVYHSLEEGFTRFLLLTFISFIWFTIVVWCIGITRQERNSIVKMIKQKIHG